MLHAMPQLPFLTHSRHAGQLQVTSVQLARAAISMRRGPLTIRRICVRDDVEAQAAFTSLGDFLDETGLNGPSGGSAADSFINTVIVCLMHCSAAWMLAEHRCEHLAGESDATSRKGSTNVCNECTLFHLACVLCAGSTCAKAPAQRAHTTAAIPRRLRSLSTLPRLTLDVFLVQMGSKAPAAPGACAQAPSTQLVNLQLCQLPTSRPI